MSDDPLAELAELALRARVEAAADSRRHRRELVDSAAESATLLGSLLDLAEAAAVVQVTAASGRRHRGVLVGVATDFVVLHGAAEVLVSIEGIVAVTLAPGEATPAVGDRGAAVELTLAEALAGLAIERTRVQIAGPGLEPVSGTVVGASTEVVSLRTATGVVLVAVGAVSDLLLV